MKSLISKELINLVTTDCHKAETSFEPFVWPNYMRLGIGAVVIVKTPDDYYLDLGDQTLNKTYMKDWNGDVGKLVCRDLRKKKFDTLYEMTTSKYKVLLRRISDDELQYLEESEMKHVQRGDYWYTIIKYYNTLDKYDSYSHIVRVDEDFEEAYNAEDDVEEDIVEEEKIQSEEELESFSLF